MIGNVLLKGYNFRSIYYLMSQTRYNRVISILETILDEYVLEFYPEMEEQETEDEISYYRLLEHAS